MSASKAVFSRVYRPQVFTQRIVLSDGSTFSQLTTSPRTSLRLTNDIRNAQLWNPDAGKSLNQEENRRMARFKDRFAGFSQEAEGTDVHARHGGGAATRPEQDDDSMDWMVSDKARSAPGMSDREMKESSTKKKKGGKK